MTAARSPRRVPDSVAVCVCAAAAGDRLALARLAPLLYRVAGRCLAARLRDTDADDLADLTSEGVVKVLERLPGACPTSDAMFYAWVRAVVWRTALDSRRQRSRRDAGWHVRRGPGATPTRRGADPWDDVLDVDARDRACVELWDVDPSDGETGEFDDLSDDCEPPLRVLARLAVDAQVQLPANTPVVLWAHLVANAGWAEVGELVGTTPSGAKRRFQRALVALRTSVWRQAAALPGDAGLATLARLRAIDPHGPRGPRGVPPS